MSRSPIDRASLLQVLAEAKISAFRLETHPVFSDPEEEAAIHAVERRLPPDFSYHDAWLDVVRGRLARGVRMQRLRLFQRPLTAYQRVEVFHVYPRSAEAGEEIRLHEVAADAEPMRRDFWLLDLPPGASHESLPDGVRGFWLRYSDKGALQHAEEARDFEVQWMARVRADFWSDAAPLAEASSLLR